MLSSAVAGASLRLRARLDNPGGAQRELLRRILERNGRSGFGAEHDFASIANETDFARRVPVRSYEQFLPRIEAAAAGRAQVLTEEPVLAFEETGGSTGGAKLVPYTQGGLAEFQAGLHAWLDDLFRSMPGLDSGSFYWSISPACRTARTTPSGIPIGMESDAAYFGAELAPHIVASLAVPVAVGACTDLAAWRRSTLAHLFGRDDLTMISVWSPSFLSELLSFARSEPDFVAAIPEPRRTALVLRELTNPAPDFAQIWPRLALISCWSHASSAASAASIQAAFPGVLVQGKGLLATEGLMSLPLHDHPFPVLALQSGYFEFRDSAGAIRTVETIEDGGEYELILTNASGWYRYAIGDLVKVRGFAGRTPMLEFLGRGSACADLCGEKLTEGFVLQALMPHRLRFAALAPDRNAMRYVLLVDGAEVSDTDSTAIRDAVERELHRNPQYAYARSLGQLAAIEIARCPQPAARWTALRLRLGQRLGDIKLPTLIDADELRQMLER